MEPNGCCSEPLNLILEKKPVASVESKSVYVKKHRFASKYERVRPPDQLHPESAIVHGDFPETDYQPADLSMPTSGKSVQHDLLNAIHDDSNKNLQDQMIPDDLSGRLYSVINSLAKQKDLAALYVNRLQQFSSPQPLINLPDHFSLQTFSYVEAAKKIAEHALLTSGWPCSIASPPSSTSTSSSIVSPWFEPPPSIVSTNSSDTELKGLTRSTSKITDSELYTQSFVQTHKRYLINV